MMSSIYSNFLNSTLATVLSFSVASCVSIRRHAYVAPVIAEELKVAPGLMTAKSGETVLSQSFSPKNIVKIETDATQKLIIGLTKALEKNSLMYIVDAPSIEGEVYCAFGQKNKITECLIDSDKDGFFDTSPATDPDKGNFFIGGGEFIGNGWPLVPHVPYVSVNEDKKQKSRIVYVAGNDSGKFQLEMDGLNTPLFFFDKKAPFDFGQPSVFNYSGDFPKIVNMIGHNIIVDSVDDNDKSIQYRVVVNKESDRRLTLGQQ